MAGYHGVIRIIRHYLDSLFLELFFDNAWVGIEEGAQAARVFDIRIGVAGGNHGPHLGVLAHDESR